MAERLKRRSPLATVSGTVTQAPRWGAVKLPQPRGDALVSDVARRRMIDRLRSQGIQTAQVLEAMNKVPRHAFVDPAFASRAYEDTALPIGHKQTISQPWVVARMLSLALTHTAPSDGPVLEIGTGCGYQAAVMAAVFKEVYSIERIAALHQLARERLRPLSIANLRLHHGDGNVGLPECAPYVAIVVAAAFGKVPDLLIQQLAPGGVLVMPVGGLTQQIVTVQRTSDDTFETRVCETVSFVPLLGGTE